MSNKYDFGFGDSFGVREALFHHIMPNVLMQAQPYFGYPIENRDPFLQRAIQGMIVRSTGRYYKNIVIVNGATAGVIAALQALSGRIGSKMKMDDLHFPCYPQMVYAAGVEWVHSDGRALSPGERAIHLTASPSNPDGSIKTDGDAECTIWDACYHNEIYTSPVASQILARPDHICMVGSLGKVTGLNGMRLGWVATDDDVLAMEIETRHYDMTLGPNTISMAIGNNFFKRVDVDSFMNRAWNHLCDNRTQLQRLEYLFGAPVQQYGMFWFTEADRKARALLQKVGVGVIEGRSCGGTRDQVRITVGQTRDLTREMVLAVLKEDGK
jgi:aspartate/methionine/tyrosine aminotransferase